MNYWPKFLTYGNWGGPGWSGGTFVHVPNLVNWDIPPIDEMDAAFKNHDYHWQHSIYSKRQADRILFEELIYINVKGYWANTYRIGAILGFGLLSVCWWRS
jgi:hypothetical protein